MKFSLIVSVLMIGMLSCNNAPGVDKTTDVVSGAVTEIAEVMKPEKLLRHVVMFKFKDTASPEQVKEIEDAFHALENQIDVIHDYEWGINNNPEGLNKGLTHCFLVTFKSEADREVYLPHPAHKAFVELLTPVLDDVTVVDYFTNKN